MSKKVLVFGGSGFLGGYLVDELLKRNYKVTVADIIKPSQKSNSLSFVKCNILDKKQVALTIKQNFDFVYNLAGYANLDKSVAEPYETLHLNIIGNLNVLDACSNSKVKRYLYASSAYATNNKGSFYGVSKLSSEKIIEEYNKKFRTPYTIMRYGSVYSEKNFDNNYIFNLIEEACKKNKIVHNGDGEEVREYIHALDAAKLSVDLLEKKEFENIHVTLTGVERLRRIDLFNMIKEMLNDKIKIELKKDGYKNHYKYTPYTFEASVSKKLVPNPYIDMGQGILECIKAVNKNEA